MQTLVNYQGLDSLQKYPFKGFQSSKSNINRKFVDFLFIIKLCQHITVPYVLTIVDVCFIHVFMFLYNIAFCFGCFTPFMSDRILVMVS